HSTTSRGTRWRRSVTEKAAMPIANHRKTRSWDVGTPTVKTIAADRKRYATGTQNRSPFRGLTGASSHGRCFVSAACGDPPDRVDPDRRQSRHPRPRGHAEGLSTLGGVSPLFRRRRRADGITADGLKVRRPHAGLLRRERRALLKARADAVADLGGLLVEMYRRGGLPDDLLAERAAASVGIDRRLAEIEDVLHAGRRVPRCECGAPVLRGSRFCPNCGRSLGRPEEAPEDVSDETVIEPAPKN